MDENVKGSLDSKAHKSSTNIIKDFYHLFSWLKARLDTVADQYKLEIIKSLLVVLFVCFLAVSPYIAALIGLLGFFYFVHQRNQKNLQKLAENKEHTNLLASLKNVFMLSEALAAHTYNVLYTKPYNKEKKDHVQQLCEEHFIDIKRMDTSSETSGIYMMSAYRQSAQNDKKVLAIGIRGTQPEWDSTVLQLFDPKGPGYDAFNKIYPKIQLAIVNRITDETDTLEIAGHSFGGAIAMMLLVNLLEEKERRASIKLGQIENLVVGVFNPAGVNVDYKNRADQLVEKFEKMNVHITFAVHDALLDPVSTSGYQIFAPTKDAKKSPNLSTYLVKKLPTLKLTARTLLKKPTLMHSLPYYLSTKDKLKDEELAYNKQAPLHCYESSFHCNHDDNEISKVFMDDSLTMVSNSWLYHFLKWLGVTTLTKIEELILFGSAVSVFCYYLVLIATQPSLLTFFSALAAIPYVMTVWYKSEHLLPMACSFANGVWWVLQTCEMFYTALISGPASENTSCSAKQAPGDTEATFDSIQENRVVSSDFPTQNNFGFAN